MYQEKWEEEDLPALKTVLMHRYNDMEKHKKGLITSTRNDNDNTVTNRMTITRKQKMGRKTTLWALYTPNKRHLIRENLDVAKERKL